MYYVYLLYCISRYPTGAHCRRSDKLLLRSCLVLYLFFFWKMFVHTCGDFGTKGMPGVFKIFFVDVVLNMARSERVLTLEMPCFVDDMGMIGACAVQVNAEMASFQQWATFFGVIFKVVKDRVAAKKQFMIGFWWDSVSRVRSLEEQKFQQYHAMLLSVSKAKCLTLHEMQSVAGKMQRIVLTLPPGAQCLCANMYSLMRGLVLPWQSWMTEGCACCLLMVMCVC